MVIAVTVAPTKQQIYIQPKLVNITLTTYYVTTSLQTNITLCTTIRIQTHAHRKMILKPLIFMFVYFQNLNRVKNHKHKAQVLRQNCSHGFVGKQKLL